MPADVDPRPDLDVSASRDRPLPSTAVIVLGVVGSVCVMLGSAGVGDLPRAQTWLQDVGMAWVGYGHGKSVSSLLFWGGVAALVVAWVAVGRHIITRTGPVAGELRRLRWAAVGWTAPLLLAVPVYSRDVYAYLAQGALLRDGLNPYVDGPATSPGPLLDSMAQVWATTTAPYGPLFMTVTRWVTELTGDNPITGVLAMRAVMLPGWALAIWAVPRLAAALGRDPRIALWLAVLNPMLLIHLVGGPHVEMLLAGLLVTGVLLVLLRRHVAGTVVLALAVAVKITAGVAVPFVLWIWWAHARERGPISRRSVAGILAAIVGITLAVFAVFTVVVGHGLGWLAGLGYADRIINWLTIPTAIAHLATLVAAPFAAVPLPGVLAVTRFVGAVVLAVTLVVVWWRSRPAPGGGGDGADDVRRAVVGVAVAMTAVLLLEPSTLPWYYSWALVVAGAAAIGRRGLAGVAAACVYLLLVFQPDDSILLYEPVSALLALVPAAVVAVALLRTAPAPTTPAPTAPAPTPTEASS
ncbi:polyprenol phosphomannose-dependent alpha 1,6 mannosyltransferase MptB [Williamsia deligens]|uniref:Polyprenol phosphomannose-dependent alpha 1,6 mannosyltransferase MptB n=1 Tax=Williamsia deligens TaxID=321325 RepID=A0ABW3GEN8_9NOCA|nr:polyprenol phosphomannose-dependent alpha 1,6 mannosyltransferase MptB [Williamsia deligens]